MPETDQPSETPETEPQAETEPETEPEQMLPASTTDAPAPMTDQPPETPFNEMIRREYEFAMDQEIKKALNKMNSRATALMSQETTLTPMIEDALGHDADWYEDLVLAVQNNDPRVGQTKEDVYNYLADLGFTEMKPIETLKKMYPIQD